MALGGSQLLAAAARQHRHAALHRRAPVVRPGEGPRGTCTSRRIGSGRAQLMDVFVLIGTLLLFIAMGVPVAYSLGLAALVAAWWADIPFEGVMIKISEGGNRFSLLAIPFFVLAGAIMAAGGMARRLINFAFLLVRWIAGRISLV